MAVAHCHRLALRSPQRLVPNRTCGKSQAFSLRTAPLRRNICKPVAAIELDWSDPDTLFGAAACVLGLGLGVGTLIWYGKVVDRDEQRLESLRELNRQTFEATGEYLSEDEIAKIRTPKWTDRREFKDND